MTDTDRLTPIISRANNGGWQDVYRFANNYGASVVRGPYTYGGEGGFYELAVLRFDDVDDKYRLVYDTPITNDVLGWLTITEVAKLLAKVEALPDVTAVAS